MDSDTANVEGVGYGTGPALVPLCTTCQVELPECETAAQEQAALVAAAGCGCVKPEAQGHISKCATYGSAVRGWERAL